MDKNNKLVLKFQNEIHKCKFSLKYFKYNKKIYKKEQIMKVLNYLCIKNNR